MPALGVAAAQPSEKSMVKRKKGGTKYTTQNQKRAGGWGKRAPNGWSVVRVDGKEAAREQRATPYTARGRRPKRQTRRQRQSPTAPS